MSPTTKAKMQVGLYAAVVFIAVGAIYFYGLRTKALKRSHHRWAQQSLIASGTDLELGIIGSEHTGDYQAWLSNHPEPTFWNMR
jgi:hypothetical protein